jgi:hypothetical protein
MKSPLKRKPLRNPGQSTDEYIHNYLTEDVFPYFMAVGAWCFLAFMEWYRWATSSPPIPIPMTIIAVLVFVFTIWKWFAVKKKLRALRLGRDGERAVGQYLERLREQGPKSFTIFRARGSIWTMS